MRFTVADYAESADSVVHFFVMSKSATVRLNSQVLSREFTRAAALLGTTRSAVLHRCIVMTVRRAKRDFPHAFGLLNDYESLVVEAIEEKNQELNAIVKYSRLDKEQVVALLAELIDKGVVVQVRRKRGEGAHGATQIVYGLGRKIPQAYST